MNSVIKWLVIGFLGSLTIFFIFVGFLIWRASPLIEISEKTGKIKILGGVIDFEDDRHWNWGGIDVKVNEPILAKQKLVGERGVDPKQFNKVFIPFRNGKFTIVYNQSGKVTWECELEEGSDSFLMAAEQNHVLTIDLDKSNISKCALNLPDSVPTVINGANGDIKIERPLADLSIVLGNGRVLLEPDIRLKYNYDIRVMNGKTDPFSSADSNDGIKIKIEVKNGFVQRS